jgi:hypothetical protein
MDDLKFEPIGPLANHSDQPPPEEQVTKIEKEIPLGAPGQPALDKFIDHIPLAGERP